MKDQFNSFAKQLEEIPKLKPEVHFVINDAASNILNGTPLTEVEHNSCDAIFIELQELDRDIVSYLLNIKSAGIISMDECLVVSSCFLATRQIGPESGNLRDIFYKSSMSLEDFEDLAKSILIPENSRKVIVNVYRKIFEFNNKIK